LPSAGLFVRRDAETQTVISAARGGVFKHFAPNAPAVTDAGLIVQTADGIAVSQSHDRARPMESLPSATGEDDDTAVVSVSGPLHWVRFETATPLKQAVLQVGMSTVGRFCRTLDRIARRQTASPADELRRRFAGRLRRRSRRVSRLRAAILDRLASVRG
jgi:hypothetical protein